MTEERSVKLATQSGITLFGNLIGKGLGFLFLVIVTRLVAPGTFGTFTLALSIVLFIQGFADLNLHRAVDYFVPQYINDGDFMKAGAVVRRVLLVGTITTVVCVILLIGVSPWAGKVFEDGNIGNILPILALALPLTFYFRVELAVFNSVKQMPYRVVTRNLARPLGKVVLTVGFVGILGGLWGLVAAYLGALIASIIVAVFLVSKTADWIHTTDGDPVDVRELVEYSAPLMFAGAMYTIISQIDFLVIGYFLSSGAVAEYRVGFQLASTLTIFVGSVSPVFKPMIAESKNETEALNRHFQSAARWLTLLVLPPAITMIVAPEPYLRLLFTETYSGASLIVPILALGYTIHSVVGPEGMVIEGIGRTRLTLVNTTLFLGVNATINVLLVPLVGVIGAAIGTATALATAVCLGISELYILRRVHPFSWPLLKMLAAGVVSIAGGIVTTLVLNSTLVIIVLPFVVLVTYISAVVVIKGFTREDLKIARLLDDRIGWKIFSPVVERGYSR